MKKDRFKLRKSHDGFTVVEIVAALFLLTACTVAFSQLVVFVSSQRVDETIRQAAVDQLQNVLEQLDGLPVEKRVALYFDKSEYEQTTRRAVPDGKIEFSSQPAEFNDSVQSFVFQATVSWNRGESRSRGEVSLFRLLTLDRKGETEP